MVTGLAAWEPSWGYLAQAVIHIGELAGVLALLWCGAAGAGALARIGIGAAVVGQVLLVVAELTYPSAPADGDPLFSVGPLLSGLGLILAGIAVLRAGRWTGWPRFVPLTLGIYVPVIMIPAIIVSGGPPASGALVALAVWDVLWLLLGVGVLTRTARVASAGAPVASR